MREAAAVQGHRKNVLDIFQIGAFHLGVLREAFDWVEVLQGYELSPVSEHPEQWSFQNRQSGRKGRLLDMGGYLSADPIALNTQARAYMTTRQDFSLALLFPGSPKRIRLNETKYTQVPQRQKVGLPEEWPTEMVRDIIKVRFRHICILDDAFLLQQIGLRHVH